MTLAHLACLLTLVFPIVTCSDLIINGDFESEIDDTNWRCNGCTLERDEDAYGGLYSGRITDRVANWGGITQYITPIPGGTYIISAKFKLLNQDSDKLWHEVEIKVHVVYASGEETWTRVGLDPHVRLDKGWIEIGGDMVFSPDEYESINVYIQIPEENINYLIDDVTMNLIEENDAWEEEANIRINEIRKSDVTFNLQLDDSIDPDGVELQFDLVKHAFPFGTAVKAHMISDTTGEYQAYQDFFYNNFNYAVIENQLKWIQMEAVQDEIDYETPELAIDILLTHGIPIRGHCVTWGVLDRFPDWLLNMTAGEVLFEVSDRITGIVSYFRDRLVHWDVDNENLHGTWFEEATGEPDLLPQMFVESNQADPNAKLFLNDFAVVKAGIYTVAMTQQALYVIESGAPIYGVGVQSHIDTPGPSVHLLKSRFDKVAEAGLPIWVTELDFGDDDVDNRADRYEDILRLYFSLEAVEGILLWGFWDQAMAKPEAALTEGSDVTPNAAGIRWQQLLFDEWTTSVTLTPSGGLTTRGFHGDYQLRILYNGDVIQEHNLTVIDSLNNVFDIIV